LFVTGAEEAPQRLGQDIDDLRAPAAALRQVVELGSVVTLRGSAVSAPRLGLRCGRLLLRKRGSGGPDGTPSKPRYFRVDRTLDR